jgi:arginine-tRNA-protein transferase
MNQMFDIHGHPEIKGDLLDQYLENGWYRFGSAIFTTNFFEHHSDVFLRVIWTRYHVPSVILSSASKTILKKSERFSFSIDPFKLTEELEALHTSYYQKLKFQASETIRSLLVDTENEVYDTYLITVRDKGELIAAGIFDKGHDSIAGIKNIFHPDYKKYSPGKLLMLLKLNYCLQEKINWYYPGYIVPGCLAFNYKLFLDKKATMLLDQEKGEWMSYKDMFLLPGNPFNLS